MHLTITLTLTLALSHLCLSRQCSGQLSQWCSPSLLKGPCSWENMLLEHVSYNIRHCNAMYDVCSCIVVALLRHALRNNACIIERCYDAVLLMAVCQEYYLQSSLCIWRTDLTIGPEPTISSFFTTLNHTSSVVFTCPSLIVTNSSIRRSCYSIFYDEDDVGASANFGADICPIYHVLLHDQSTGIP